MRFSPIIIVSFILVFITITVLVIYPTAMAENSTESKSKFVTLLDKGFKLKITKKQKGDVIEDKITRKNFKEVTIAQGSGLDGFDAIRLFEDGSGYIVFSNDPPWENKKVKISLSTAELDGLLVALNNDKISKIKGMYSSGVMDGTQGFIEIKTKKGRRFTWLDNYFNPLTNTYRYCNKVIWPKIIGATIDPPKIDRQEEYHRIFNKAASNKH